MKKLRNCSFTVLLLLFLFFTFSCKTIFFQHPQEPFIVLGDDFSVYTLLDTKRDKKTIDSLLKNYIPELSEKNKTSLLSYVSKIYAGFSLKTNEFSLYIEGNFPSLLKTQFNKKNGWEKNIHTSNFNSKKFQYFSHKDYFNLAIVSKNIIFLSNKNISQMIDVFYSRDNQALYFPKENFENEAFSMLKKSIDREGILFYLAEPKDLISFIIPFDTDLALDSMYVFAKEEELSYVLDIDFVFSDIRAIKPALLLLNIAFFNDTIEIKQVSENQIFLQGLRFSLDTIFEKNKGR